MQKDIKNILLNFKSHLNIKRYKVNKLQYQIQKKIYIYILRQITLAYKCHFTPNKKTWSYSKNISSRKRHHTPKSCLLPYITTFMTHKIPIPMLSNLSGHCIQVTMVTLVIHNHQTSPWAAIVPTTWLREGKWNQQASNFNVTTAN